MLINANMGMLKIARSGLRCRAKAPVRKRCARSPFRRTRNFQHFEYSNTSRAFAQSKSPHSKPPNKAQQKHPRRGVRLQTKPFCSEQSELSSEENWSKIAIL
jgi:hypothetical protein